MKMKSINYLKWISELVAKRKIFRPDTPVMVSEKIDQKKSNLTINLPPNPSGHRNINFEKYLGAGVDEWVWATATQLQSLLENERVTPATIAAYYRNGWRSFYEFLRTHKSKPSNFSSEDLLSFSSWLLTDKKYLKQASKKCSFSHMKAILIGLAEHGVIATPEKNHFRNKFPGANRSSSSQLPLAEAEKRSILAALKLDLIALHQNRFSGTDGQGLVVYALAIALRTGMNRTPLVELKRNALTMHPMLSRMGLLRSFKRRNRSFQVNPLVASDSAADESVVPMDGVAIFQKALSSTSVLASLAPDDLSQYLWLYRSQRNGEKGKIVRMTERTFSDGLDLFITRHNLRDEHGEALRLNSQRLRKTIENRLWSLSNGDLISVANAMGQTPKVADIHYITVTKEIQIGAASVSEALPEVFSGRSLLKKRELYEATPVGGCMDSKNGDRAPKDDSNHCHDFLNCFGCRSFAIVEDDEDLHRLYSFYWYLIKEKDRMGGGAVAQRYEMTSRKLDEFIAANFSNEMISRIKLNAQRNPHVFWLHNQGSRQ